MGRYSRTSESPLSDAAGIRCRTRVRLLTLAAALLGSLAVAGAAPAVGATVSVDDVTVNEVAGDATFTVSLADITTETFPITVDYETVDGTATAGADYLGIIPGTLTFNDATPLTVDIPIIPDGDDEVNETFAFNLLNLDPQITLLGSDVQGVATIIDNDGPAVSVAATPATVSEAGPTASFTISLSATSPQPVTVTWATANVSATAGSDYTASGGTEVIAAGDTSAVVTVPITNDTTDEANETFNVTLSAPINATLGTATATVTITDNDGPAVSVAATPATVSEAGPTASFTISLSATSPQPVTVTWATANVSATAGSDYTASGGTEVIAAGDTSAVVTVPITNDTTDEANETFNVTLSAPINATLGTATATVTITDNDGPAVSVAPTTPSVAEGAANASFTISLSAVSPQNVSVTWSTADGAALAGEDYTTAGGTATITAGQTSTAVLVPILDDSRFELTEDFDVTISAPVNGTLGTSTATMQITNDDATPTLAVADLTAIEANAGLHTVNVTVSIPTASGVAIPFTYATVAGGTATAGAGNDYVAIAGATTTLPAGQTSVTFPVQINGDQLDEADETVNLQISAASNATIGDPTAVLTITDDDTPPTLTIGDDSVLEIDTAGANIAFPWSLNVPSGRTITVQYATGGGTATAGADYTTTTGTLTIPAGTTSGTITVPVAGDLSDENDETFNLTLANPQFVSAPDLSAVGTITDDDAPPTVSIAPVAVQENAGPLTFTATVSVPSGKPITVAYATANTAPTASALAGVDYTATSGTLSFAPDVATQTFNVALTDDVLDEPDETFTATLSTPVNASLGTATAVGTINDNDATPALTVDSVTVTEGNGAPQAVVFTASLSAVSGQGVSFDWDTGTGTANPVAPNQDYVPGGATATIPAGQLTTTFQVTVNGDVYDELNESVQILLSNAINVTLPGTSPSLNITDDDTTNFTIGAGAATEADAAQTSTATFVLSRNMDADHAVTVNWATALDTGGTNPAEVNDFVAQAPLAATFNPGDPNTRNVTVTITGDDVDEDNETFRVTLTPVTAGTTAGTFGLGTITDDDQTVFSIGAAAQTELDTGGSNAMTFTVTRSRPSDHTVTVNFATATGGANPATAGTDYVARPSTALPFLASDGLTQPVNVTINGDAVDENAETLQVVLTATGDTALGTGTGTGTITDDDVTNFTINSVSQTELDATQSNLATFTITRDRQSDHPVTVNYATANTGPTVSAAAGSDYTATSGSFTFPADEATADPTRTVDVTILGDDVDENTETFQFNLTPGADTTATPGTGVGTILDNDTAALSINDITVSEGNGDLTPSTTFTFNVSTDRPTDHAISATWTTSDGTALAAGAQDYVAATGTVTFPANTSADQLLTVQIRGDLLDEDNGTLPAAGTIADETFNVTLSAPTAGATLADALGVATIADDDAVPSITIAPVTVTEGTDPLGVATTPAVFAVTLSAASGLPISATVNTAPGTAVSTANPNSPADFTAIAGDTVSFAPGSTTPVTPLTVAVAQDTVDEGTDPSPETFTTTLSAPVNAVAGAMSATGTINDDDALPTITIGDATITEGNAGTAQATFTVTLSNPSHVTVLATRTSSNGTATAPADYTALPAGTVSVPPLAISNTFTVSVHGDLLDEPDFDTAFVTLSAPFTAVAPGADLVGQLNIQDDDALPILRVQPSPEHIVTEGNTGAPPLNLTLQLVNSSGVIIPSGRNVTVNYRTATPAELSGFDWGALATANADFGAVASTPVTFLPGETTKALPIGIIGDTDVEPAESIGVILSSQVNADPALPETQHIVILDNDHVNQAPFANNDSLTATRNVPTTINVRANDTDPDGDGLRIESNTQPAHGVASCQSNGDCLYSPTPGYIGPDSFTYTVSDFSVAPALTDVGTVTVNVINAPPVANTDTVTVGQGTPGGVNVVANDTDPDGGTLTVTGGTNGAHGLVTCAGTSCTYAPVPSYVGTDTFTYSVSDGIDTTVGTVTVTVAKGKPLVASVKAAAASSRIGQQNGYTVSITNPNGAAVTLTSVNICIPKGFAYVARSTTAPIAKNPVRAGCGGGKVKLTWAKKVKIKANGKVTFRLRVTVGGVKGRVKATVGGKAADGFAVATSKPGATILVKAR